MFKRIIADLETNGLLEEVSKVHVLGILCLDTKKVLSFRSRSVRGGIETDIEEGLAIVKKADLVVWHNGIKYDSQVIKKLYGIDITWKKQLDTLVLSRLIWPDLAKQDMDARVKKSKAGKEHIPGNLTGSHSLEAWGYRLGEHKGEYRGDPAIEDKESSYKTRWDSWNQAMEDYCIQDLQVTAKLLDLINSKVYSPTAVDIELQVASIIGRQERYGFLFYEKAAVALYAKLVARKLEIHADVVRNFKPRYRRVGKTFIPARDSSSGYVKGAPITKVVLTDFNPDSRDHICEWLKAYYGWEPAEFTAEGKPKVDDESLSILSYPEVAPLKEYLMISKRIGQIAEGKEAWLKKVGKDGRMHGSLNTNGAVTGRMTHSHPNMGQVPASYSPYGEECRALYIAGPGKVLVGCDADALELRDLAGYMAFYDGGRYTSVVTSGDKKLGTDMHSVNARALGLDPKRKYYGEETGRDLAKTYFYAFIYGAGDEKLGSILLKKRGEQARAKGKETKASLFAALPALANLIRQVGLKAKATGFLKGLDGRELPVRSAHSALNTLLQAAGAIQMKKALCILDDDLQAAGFIPGINYEFVANVHDEWQIEVDHEISEQVGSMAAESIRKAGEYFNFKCPLAGQYKIGRNWAETH